MIIVNTMRVSSFFTFHFDPGCLPCIVMGTSEMMGRRKIVPLVDTMHVCVCMRQEPKIESAFVLEPKNNAELQIDEKTWHNMYLCTYRQPSE